VTATDGKEGADRLTDQTFDAVVLDLKMPGMDGQALLEWIRLEGLRTPVVMISALGDINDAVKALKSGASDYLIKPFDPTELIFKVKAVVQSRKREDLIEAGSRTAEGTVRLLGESAATRALRLMIEKVATGTTTVLITGESGTGKEVVAREIHARSLNAAEPFVAVNIGGIHETLVESELFGHEKGAFTGADTRKTGLFELADGGTLFLDEIAEMPFPLQVKLLRVLQERKIRRLGGTRDIPIAARILSATNKNIESLVRSGAFREDLYYRLNVVRITVPPLRDRREDIPLLAGNILEKIRARAGRGAKTLSPDALEALMQYSYPGNIRELENILERAVITSEDDVIMAADIALDRLPRNDGAASAAGSDRPLKPMMELERDALVKALSKWEGNRTRAAEELGISRRTILNKIKQYGL
jgi:two-component system response regulator AtoC